MMIIFTFIVIIYLQVSPFFSPLESLKSTLDSYTILVQVCDCFLPLISVLNFSVQAFNPFNET